jgi:hypothetical protein
MNTDDEQVTLALGATEKQENKPSFSPPLSDNNNNNAEESNENEFLTTDPKPTQIAPDGRVWVRRPYGWIMTGGGGEDKGLLPTDFGL